MAFIQPFDLESILIDKLAGNMAIFIILALLVIAIFAARFRMPNVVFGGMIMIFLVFLATTNALGEGSQLKGLLLIGAVVISLFLVRAMTNMTDG